MPKAAFEDLWKKLKSRENWSGVVKNLRKDEGFYLVYAEISTVYTDGELIGYKSIRTPIYFEEKINHQLLYDQMKKEANEPTRKVIYS